jgi:hypothetical protein
MAAGHNALRAHYFAIGALENWESEGGAPASDDRSTKRKRPRVLNQIAKAQPLTDHRQKAKEDLGPTPLSLRLKKMLAAGVSKYHPAPLAALSEKK